MFLKSILQDIILFLKKLSIKSLRNLLFFIKQWKIVFPQNCLKLSGAGFRNLALIGCLVTTLTPYNMLWFLLLFSGINVNKIYLSGKENIQKHFSASLNVFHLQHLNFGYQVSWTQLHTLGPHLACKLQKCLLKVALSIINI